MPESALHKLIEAGAEFTEQSRRRAEELVERLVAAGDLQRNDADEMIADFVERGRETSEKLARRVQQEVTRQVERMSQRFDEFEDRIDDLAAQFNRAGSSSSAGDAARARGATVQSGTGADGKKSARKQPGASGRAQKSADTATSGTQKSAKKSRSAKSAGKKKSGTSTGKQKSGTSTGKKKSAGTTTSGTSTGKQKTGKKRSTGKQTSAGKKKSGTFASEPAQADAAPVGSSGVRRVATKRSER